MTVTEWIKSLNKVHDPREALKLLVENDDFLGFDPYYRDIRGALFAMAERVLEETK